MRIIFGSRHAACWVAMVLAPVASLADVCDVPSAEYPTVQRAVDTPICTTVNLTDPSYPESVLIRRSLSISGPAALAIIEGLVEVRGGGTVVQMDNLSIENGCTPSAFLTSEGSQVNTERLEVQWTDGGPCPAVAPTQVFSDDFESGNTSAWSEIVP